MRISYDPAKRIRTLHERALDFEDTFEVFAYVVHEHEDARKDYGERRMICFGYLEDVMIVVCYTERSGVRHIISMRKANGRERKKITKTAGV